MNCVSWYNKTSRLIRKEKWSKIKQAEYCNCLKCKEDLFLIEMMFIKEGKFCKEAQKAALYLNKNQKLNWMEAIIRSPMSMETLRSVIEEGLVDVNSTSYYDSLASFLLFNDQTYWTEVLEYLFSKGCSVDIQDECGRTLLMTANAGWNGYQHYMTKFLMERGADPFLEDKEGYSMVSYAREYFSQEDKDKFFGLLDSLGIRE